MPLHIVRNDITKMNVDAIVNSADPLLLGGDGVGLIFRRGEIIKKVPQEQLVDALMDEIAHYEGE